MASNRMSKNILSGGGGGGMEDEGGRSGCGWARVTMTVESSTVPAI